MYDHLFDEQDSFGLKPWSEFASEAGVRTALRLIRTSSYTASYRGKQLRRYLDVQGTSTVIVKGWKLGHPSSEQELDGLAKVWARGTVRLI
jgi:hypothetical protein